jgi:K+-transporting ATPase KdpF subunit
VADHRTGPALEELVNIMYLIGGILSVTLLVYLLIALLKPEKF